MSKINQEVDMYRHVKTEFSTFTFPFILANEELRIPTHTDGFTDQPDYLFCNGTRNLLTTDVKSPVLLKVKHLVVT